MSLELNTDSTSLSFKATENSQNNDFKISEDGKLAVKYFTYTDSNGIKKNYAFRIYFAPKSSQSANQQLLKKYTSEKIQTLGKMSIELGLGEKYKGMSFSGSGTTRKLDLMKYDGSVKKIDDNYFKGKNVD